MSSAFIQQLWKEVGFPPPGPPHLSKKITSINLLYPLSKLWIWRRLDPPHIIQAVRCLLLMSYALLANSSDIYQQALPLHTTVQHALEDFQETLMNYPQYWEEFEKVKSELDRTIGQMHCEIYLHIKNGTV